jgi:hypothetical protein
LELRGRGQGATNKINIFTFNFDVDMQAFLDLGGLEDFHWQLFDLRVILKNERNLLLPSSGTLVL